MNTKHRGSTSEAHIMAALLEQGLTVLVPWGENCKYDLLTENQDGAFTRIQCKTGRMKDGYIDFGTSSTYRIKGEIVNKDYRGHADLFGVYCPQNNKCYLISVSVVGKRGGRLRLEAPKGKGQNEIKMAGKYEI